MLVNSLSFDISTSITLSYMLKGVNGLFTAKAERRAELIGDTPRFLALFFFFLFVESLEPEPLPLLFLS
jgi:hypothetical protein